MASTGNGRGTEDEELQALATAMSAVDEKRPELEPVSAAQPIVPVPEAEDQATQESIANQERALAMLANGRPLPPPPAQRFTVKRRSRYRSNLAQVEPPAEGADGASLGTTRAARANSQRATKGFAWSLSRSLFNRGLSFISFAVLARLLTGADYGVAALANVFVVLLLYITSAGLAQALVQRQNIDEADLDSAFWMSTGLGVGLTIVLVLGAWPLAAAIGQPQLRPVLQAMSVCLLFAGLASASQAILQRRFAFGVLAKNGMASNIVATAVGVTFAFLGFGVWSLVIQTIIANGGASIGLIYAARFRPGRRASWARIRSLLSFSVRVLGVQLTNVLNTRTDDFLIGTVLGAAELGVYTVAYSALIVMNDVLTKPVQGVVFPFFSRLQHDVPRLRQAYLTASRLAIFGSAPIFLFVAASAPELIPGLFGGKWHASVRVMQILCLYAPLNCVLQFNAALLTSIGRPRTVFRIALAGTVLQVAFFGVAVNFGIEAVAASYVLRAYLIAPVGFVIASRALGGALRPILIGMVPVVISCAVMILAVEGMRTLLVHNVPDLVAVAGYAAVAFPAYLLTMRLIAPDRLTQALRYAQTAMPGRLVLLAARLTRA